VRHSFESRVHFRVTPEQWAHCKRHLAIRHVHWQPASPPASGQHAGPLPFSMVGQLPRIRRGWSSAVWGFGSDAGMSSHFGMVVWYVAMQHSDFTCILIRKTRILRASIFRNISLSSPSKLRTVECPICSAGASQMSVRTYMMHLSANLKGTRVWRTSLSTCSQLEQPVALWQTLLSEMRLRDVCASKHAFWR
jgi:hypothetical protein